MQSLLGRRPEPSPAAVREIKEVFRKADEGGKGYLGKDDLDVALVGLLGYAPSKYELEQLRRAAEVEGTGMTEDLFVHLMGPKMARVDSHEVIRQTFLMFDVGCKGFVSLDDFRVEFSVFASSIPANVVDETFAEIDRDKDGRITYKDFEILLRYFD